MAENNDRYLEIRRSRVLMILFLTLTIAAMLSTLYFYSKLKDKNVELKEMTEELSFSKDSIIILNNNLISSKDTLNQMRDSLTTILKDIINNGFENSETKEFVDLRQLIMRSENLGLEEGIKNFEISVIYQSGQKDIATKIRNGLWANGYTNVIRKPVDFISDEYSTYAIVTSNEIDVKLAEIIKRVLNEIIPETVFSINESIYEGDRTPNSLSIMLKMEQFD